MTERDKEAFSERLLTLRAMYPNDYGLHELFPLAYWECLRRYSLEAVLWAMDFAPHQQEYSRRMPTAPELAGFAKARQRQLEERRQEATTCPRLSGGHTAPTGRMRNPELEEVVARAGRTGENPARAIMDFLARKRSM